MFDCLVAGDANVDLLVEGVLSLDIGTEKLASDMNLLLGGSSSITAFNLSRLGAAVTFSGVIGQDLFGHFVEEKLANGGVDLTGLRRAAGSKTGVTIWHSCQGKRAAITYAGTSALLSAKDFPENLLKSARHLHVGAYFLLTRLHADAPEVFARAKCLGLTTSVDCNYDPLESWNSHLLAVLPHVDIFLPNEDEALKITRQRSAQEAARKLAALAKMVVLKRGAEGALVVTGDTEFAIPAIPTKVVDSTGAGDSFNAGFLAAFLKGSELRACAESGALAGSRSVQYVGGTAAFES